jgi:D-beta-D-heptose 7-phosphate kinase/D-beta-D-heptose 1-phosphate adenosyltransferase
MSKVESSLVFEDVVDLGKHLEELCPDTKVIMASGGFDPMHVGHLQYLQEAAKINSDYALVVVVNSDDWLMRKKGFIFMPWEERAAMVAGVSGVDFVVGWDDGTSTVTGAIGWIRPAIFAKGGDRDTPEKIPEYTTCRLIGCKVVMNVGGGKIQSSSELVGNLKD